MPGQGGDGRQLIDEPRNLFRTDVKPPDAVALDDDPTPRLAGIGRRQLDLHARSETAEHADKVRSRRVQADVFDFDP